MIFIDDIIAIITQNNFDAFFCRYTSENVEEIMDIDNIMRELKSFMNERQQLVVLPGKYKKKLIAYYYLATKIEIGQRYTESDINDILNQWAIFHDSATLRRELYNKHLLNRTNDCRYYWREEELPPLEEFIAKYV